MDSKESQLRYFAYRPTLAFMPERISLFNNNMQQKTSGFFLTYELTPTTQEKMNKESCCKFGLE